MKVKHPIATRLMMLGIREEWGELSWTREDDAPINLGIRGIGAKLYKRYRVFQRAL